MTCHFGCLSFASHIDILNHITKLDPRAKQNYVFFLDLSKKLKVMFCLTCTFICDVFTSFLFDDPFHNVDNHHNVNSSK